MIGSEQQNKLYLFNSLVHGISSCTDQKNHTKILI